MLKKEISGGTEMIKQVQLTKLDVNDWQELQKVSIETYKDTFDPFNMKTS